MAVIANNLFHRLFGAGTFGRREAQTYCTDADLAVLVALCRTFAPRTVVEIGVQRGATAALLLRECPAIRHYIGIDIEPGAVMPLPGQQSEIPAFGEAGELADTDPRFRLVLRPHGTADLAPEDLVKADLVFIDGDHSAAAVRRDTELARAIMPQGGIVVWHDYGNRTVQVSGVIDALNQAEGDHITLVSDTWMCVEFRGAAPEPLSGERCPPEPPNVSADPALAGLGMSLLHSGLPAASTGSAENIEGAGESMTPRRGVGQRPMREASA